ncbi:MAG: hypothetical protein AMXMBFR45_05100 [Gammaproteobacteria bacterium]|nr:NAD-dependent epimerase/dehydratase family protein [Gammaproteobacteria bacterium]MCE7901674.1 NAD-dependent epimerase/dehydratase family protein [Gammaproteobacteria bacterium PRO9]MDL1880593.1 NAD-dependent epimerase/dehydratase family protein [Gammaproteobacteria bacterium PRO2]GIK35405.1 MAG: hypothetical protein BroJett010_19640 [Gammaproteobacteria bacterium]
MNFRRWWMLVAGLAACLFTMVATAATASPREVLVLGGTGKVGARIVRQLVAGGNRVTVFARAGSDHHRIADLPVQYAIGDLTQAADIAAALHARTYNIVISAVRVQDNDPHFFERFMQPLASNAHATGVQQLIHHSAVGAGANLAKFAGRGWEKNPGLVERLKDQGIAEDILRASGVPYTIIRNAGIYPDSAPATGTAELTEDDTALTSMTRADVARLTMQCVGNPACLGKTFHIRDPSLPWRPPQPDQDRE